MLELMIADNRSHKHGYILHLTISLFLQVYMIELMIADYRYTYTETFSI